MERRNRSVIDAELDALENQLKTIQIREDEFQRIIDSMNRMKNDFISERMNLQHKRNVLKAEREPINWLPTELLVQIFLALSALDCNDTKCRAPVIISHVCQKWRGIVIYTPHLWARLLLQTFREREAAETYLERSGEVPLEIDFRSSSKNMPNSECHQVANLLITTKSHFHRLQKLSLQCNIVVPFIYLLPSLRDHAKRLPQLSELTLSILTPNPSFLEASSLLNSDWAESDSNACSSPRSYTKPLRRLKLEQIPLLSLPKAFIENLRSLELSFPEGKFLTRNHYHLKMSTLGRFLSSTPLLEELILTNTVPAFDITPPSDTGSATTTEGPSIEMHPVKLNHLKEIDWTYACIGAVHQLFSWIEAPNLERLDLWVERLPSNSRDVGYMRGGQLQVVGADQRPPGRSVVHFPNLRDLSLQYSGEDTIASVLRRFRLPILEKVAFTNVDTAGRESGEEPPSLPTFPRLESILFDPRLTHLTNLTLSRQNISKDSERAEAMLGYMSVLTSLSFDSCTGVGRLLAELKERVFENVKEGGKVGVVRSRRGVKVCPRLEALSFWSCQDVECGSLRAVVLSRNRSTTDLAEDRAQNTDVVPNGATQHVTRGVQNGNASGGQKTEEAQMGRQIKPLRKPSRHRPELGTAPNTAGLTPSTNIVSKIIAIEESFQPAHIIYLRVADCKMISQDDLLSFRDLDVVDVIWAGPGLK